jgi:hypothetical protein
MMQIKKRVRELDVDFIGGQNNPLTKEEEIAISTFIQKLKEKKHKSVKKKTAKVQ